MSKNNRLLCKSYKLKISVSGVPVDEPPKLHRFSKKDSIRIEVDVDCEKEFDGLLLHTDMISAEWKMIPFEKKDGEYYIELSELRGGRGAWRFAAVDSDALFWEPEEYHQVLIDPEFMEALAMYTLIPNISGRFSDWTASLSELSTMGFNAVHILPFTRMGYSESPYSSSDLFSVDPAYGDSVEDFSRFTAEASRLGIAVCLDIVLNHIASDSGICKEHAEWIVPDSERSDGMKRAGCYHQDSWISWEDLVLLDYDHPDPQIRRDLYSYMLEYVLFWINAAGKCDIILRLDNLHSSNSDFIRWLIPELRNRHPDIIILSEFFGADYHIEDAVRKYGLNLVTANSWEYPFAPSLQNYIASIHSRSGNARYLLSPVSHDTRAAAELFGTAESSVPRYAVCALMGTGITGAVQGFEYGVETKIDFIGRNAEMPKKTKTDFRHFISQSNRLMLSEESLRIKGNIEFFDTGNDSLIVCKRRTTGTGSILIAVNLDIFNTHSFEYHLIGRAEPLICENSEVKHKVHEDILSISIGACGVCAVRIRR